MNMLYKFGRRRSRNIFSRQNVVLCTSLTDSLLQSAANQGNAINGPVTTNRLLKLDLNTVKNQTRLEVSRNYLSDA